jgi:hypothetical protein
MKRRRESPPEPACVGPDRAVPAAYGASDAAPFLGLRLAFGAGGDGDSYNNTLFGGFGGGESCAAGFFGLFNECTYFITNYCIFLSYTNPMSD